MSRVLCQRHSDPVEMTHVSQMGQATFAQNHKPAVYRCPVCAREVLVSSVAACENALKDQIVTLVTPSGQLRATTDPRHTRR